MANGAAAQQAEGRWCYDPRGGDAEASRQVQPLRRALQLEADGFAVIPCCAPAGRAALRAALRASLADHVEYTAAFRARLLEDFDRAAAGKALGPLGKQARFDRRPVGGDFGALAVPSSFHSRFARRLRRELAELLEPTLRFVEDLRLASAAGGPPRRRARGVCYDRVKYYGTVDYREGLHRDEAVLRTGGRAIGGWANLSAASEQRFHCVRGSHWGHAVEMGGRRSGFGAVKDPAEKAALQARMEAVTVPPGHVLVFYEDIAHEVARNPAGFELSERFFNALVLGDHLPLFEETTEWALRGMSPKLKSGQKVVELPAAYYSYPKLRRLIVEHSARFGADWRGPHSFGGQTPETIEGLVPRVHRPLGDVLPPDEFCARFEYSDADLALLTEPAPLPPADWAAAAAEGPSAAGCRSAAEFVVATGYTPHGNRPPPAEGGAGGSAPGTTVRGGGAAAAAGAAGGGGKPPPTDVRPAKRARGAAAEQSTQVGS